MAITASEFHQVSPPTGSPSPWRGIHRGTWYRGMLLSSPPSTSFRDPCSLKCCGKMAHLNSRRHFHCDADSYREKLGLQGHPGRSLGAFLVVRRPWQRRGKNSGNESPPPPSPNVCYPREVSQISSDVIMKAWTPRVPLKGYTPQYLRPTTAYAPGSPAVAVSDMNVVDRVTRKAYSRRGVAGYIINV